jgi:hypothetical protein
MPAFGLAPQGRRFVTNRAPVAGAAPEAMVMNAAW